MARINFRSSTEKEHHELVLELKALKDTVRELTEKLDKLSVNSTTGHKNTSQEREKEEGIFKIGDEVKLKIKAKYGRKGDIGRVEHVGKVFLTIRLDSGKTTTRQPQNLSHHKA